MTRAPATSSRPDPDAPGAAAIASRGAADRVIAVAIVAALAAPWLPLPDPDAVDTPEPAPAARTPGHPLGTDEFGRDLLSRLVWGARVSLLAGVGTAAAAMLIGREPRAPRRLLPRLGRDLIMRFTDILMAFPFILLAIAIVAGLGPGLATP